MGGHEVPGNLDEGFCEPWPLPSLSLFSLLGHEMSSFVPPQASWYNVLPFIGLKASEASDLGVESSKLGTKINLSFLYIDYLAYLL